MDIKEKEFRDELYGSRTDLSEIETQCILELLNKFDEPRYLEIGVYFCGTFRKVLDFLSQNKENYYATGVDLFELIAEENSGEQTHKIINKWRMLNVALHKDIVDFLEDKGYENFTLVKGHSDKVLDSEKFDMDLYFIDGNHTYLQTKKDAESCILSGGAGSYIVFHNASNDQVPDIHYVERDGGPWKVCEELKLDPRVEFVEKADRCVVFKRIDDE